MRKELAGTHHSDIKIELHKFRHPEPQNFNVKDDPFSKPMLARKKIILCNIKSTV